MEADFSNRYLFTNIWVPREGHLYSASRSSPTSTEVQLDILWNVETVVKYTTADGVSSIMGRWVGEEVLLEVPQFDFYDIFMSSDETFGEAFSGLFDSMGMDPIYRNRAIYHIVGFARKMQDWVSRMTPGVVIPIRADIILRTEYQLFQPQVTGMIPATTASIMALKSETYVLEEGGDQSDDQTCCVICLEELVAGSQVTRMPCSHVFHDSCITTWLKESHVCPICRFEMPTSDSN